MVAKLRGDVQSKNNNTLRFSLLKPSHTWNIRILNTEPRLNNGVAGVKRNTKNFATK